MLLLLVTLIAFISMTLSGSEAMPFSCCIRDAFSVLGITTPITLTLLSSFKDLAVCWSVEVSVMSPFSFCAFPSENMTRILNIIDDLLTLTF